jgi:S-adenosylmethionine hydrolase
MTTKTVSYFLNCSLESTVPVGLPGVHTKRRAVFSQTSAGTAFIASDECYSELWFDQAPTGLLEVCAELGRDDYKNISFLNCSLESTVPVGLPGVHTKRRAVFSQTSAGTLMNAIQSFGLTKHLLVY